MQLPMPMALDIHDVNAADKWQTFFNVLTNYTLATELDSKPQPVQVATLLTVIGEDCRHMPWMERKDDRLVSQGMDTPGAEALYKALVSTLYS